MITKMACVICAACALLLGASAFAEDNGTGDEAQFRLPRGVRRIDGRVKEIDLKLMKVAVEVEVEPDKPAQIMIFQMTSETKARKRENALSVDEIRKGNPVLVWYVPAEKKGDPAKAVLIRVLDYPRRGR